MTFPVWVLLVLAATAPPLAATRPGVRQPGVQQPGVRQPRMQPGVRQPGGGARPGSPVSTDAGTVSSADAGSVFLRGPRAGWGWPLAPRPRVVRPFDPPPQPWAPGHRGVDLAARVGQDVLAAGAGVVSFSGVVAGRGVVTVTHAGGWRTTYEPVEQRLAAGSMVRQGQRLAVVQPVAGHCAPAVCLHWGAIRGGTYHDPLLLLGLVRAVLLPLESA